MKVFTILCLVFGMFTTVSASEGKEVFEAQKCTKCHTVDSQEIATTSKKDPSEVADLSNAGNKFDSAEALKAYLNKETEVDGKKHKLKYKGEEADLQVLVDWVLTLKQ